MATRVCVERGRLHRSLEPQISAWQDFCNSDAHIAAEYRESEEAEPIFGLIGLRGESARNSDDGTIIIRNMQVPQIDFRASDRTQIGKLSVDIGQLLPAEPLAPAEERVLVSLASVPQMSDVERLKKDPPVIYASEAAGRLLQTNGPATFAPVRGAPEAASVLNTNCAPFRVNDISWMRDGSRGSPHPRWIGLGPRRRSCRQNCYPFPTMETGPMRALN